MKANSKAAAALVAAAPHDIRYDAGRVSLLCRMSAAVAELIANEEVNEPIGIAAEAIMDMLNEASSLAGEVEVFVKQVAK